MSLLKNIPFQIIKSNEKEVTTTTKCCYFSYFSN